MNPDDSARTGTTIADMVPAAWHYPERSAVWASAYRMFLVSDEDRGESGAPTILVDFPDVRAVGIRGKLPTFRSARLEIQPWVTGPIVLETAIDEPSDEESPEGLYLLVFAKVPVEWDNDDERRAHTSIDEAVTLIRMSCGRNAAFDEVLSGVVFRGDKTTQHGLGIDYPGALGPPDLSDEAHHRLRSLHSRIESLEPADRDSLRSALHWAKRGEETSGPDGLLPWRIAIETAVRDGNPHTVRRLMAELYGLSPDAVESWFQIGRIFRLRGRIVHGGDRSPVHSGLLAYLRALFIDVVHARCGMPSDEAGSLLDLPGFDLDMLVNYGAT